MIFEDYRTVFLVSVLVSVLLAASPALSIVVSLPSGGERFSELWVLGPNRMAEDYPFNVRGGEEYKIYLGIGNHMGGVMYYGVLVKFRNQSQLLPNSTLGLASSLPVLCEFRAVVEDGGTWEEEVRFSFPEIVRLGNMSNVKGLVINDRLVGVDAVAGWDSEQAGCYFQLFFELWLYDAGAKEFGFHNRFVGVWLNMTG